MIKTGAVAKAGTSKKTGAKNKDNKKSPAVTKVVIPVLPPTTTPAALSAYVLIVDVPSTAPIVVPTANTKKAYFT